MAKPRRCLNHFHSTFEETLKKVGEQKAKSLVSEMLTTKFSEKGIRLTRKEIKTMAEQLLDGKTEINIDNKNTADVHIEITTKETRRVEIEFNKWLRRNQKTITKAYQDSANKTADAFLKTVKRKTKEHVKFVTKKRTDFQNRLERIWKAPFDLLEMYIAYVEDIIIECHNEYVDSETEDLVFDVLMKLECRALRIAQEILILIKSGYADGAHARWRSLHELAVVATVIEKYGEPTAERYLAHDAVEYCKGAEQFQLYARKLGQRVIPKREMIKVRKASDHAVATFGDNFKSEYGWAAFALKPNNPKYKPTFTDLEANVNLAKWRPYYRKASWNVHAGSSGIASSLGLLGQHQHLTLLGASGVGFADPAQGASTSLMQITSTVLNREASLDRQIRALVLIRMNDQIGEEFFKVQERFEAA